MSRRVVYVDHVVELLHQLMKDNFTVMDPSYSRYLDALSDVEKGLKDLHQLDASKIRTGEWMLKPGTSTKFICSICGAEVWFQDRIPKGSEQKPVCKYPFCPRCRTAMEAKHYE